MTLQRCNNLIQNQAPSSDFSIDINTIKIVDEFKYLSFYINSIEKDVKTRIALAWTAFDKLKYILKI